MLPESFHPAVAGWFRSAFPAPTSVQLKAWDAIGAGTHTLISAPTGSGKTLAAFLGVIDLLAKQAAAGDAARRDADSLRLAAQGAVERHREEPARAARRHRPRVRRAHARRCADPRGRAHGRHAAERARAHAPPAAAHPRHDAGVAVHPAHTESGRNMLRTVRTVIVDEIHALAGNKRGAHLALSLERLEALCARPPTRVGISATTKPIDVLTASSRASPTRRARSSTKATRASAISRSSCRARRSRRSWPNEVWIEEYDRLAELIRAHRTTLVFVNTRRLAERAARHLAERLGEDAVTSHHGSLAKEHRLQGRGAAQGRAAQGARRDVVARARHRHRRRRSRLPARLAARDRGVPAARRPLGPRARPRCRRAGCSRCRATTSSSARRCSRASGARELDAIKPRPRAARRARAADRRRGRRAGVARRGSAPALHARRELSRSVARRASSASRACSPTASRRTAAGAARICTSTASTTCCAAGAAPR